MTEKQNIRYNEALDLVKIFSEINHIKLCSIEIIENTSILFYCGEYIGKKNGKIFINPKLCANEVEKPNRMCWSHPHYFVDRTIYGVLCHEFGHHVHRLKNYPSIPYENKISKCEFDDGERFAETFRLFLSNSDLLKQYNQKRYDYLVNELQLIPVIKEDWKTVMLKDNMNEKFISASENRLK